MPLLLLLKKQGFEKLQRRPRVSSRFHLSRASTSIPYFYGEREREGKLDGFVVSVRVCNEDKGPGILFFFSIWEEEEDFVLREEAKRKYQNLGTVL